MLSVKFVVLLLCSTMGAELFTRSVNVQGPIFGNAIWTQANSPYIVTGDFQVPTNVELTLEPGTQVIFSGDFQILIKGRINVQGTPSLSQCNSLDPTVAKPMLHLQKYRFVGQCPSTMPSSLDLRPAIQLAAEGEHSQDADEKHVDN